MNEDAWGVIALIVFIIGAFAYGLLDRWCDHKEEMRGKK